ncbi:hypothetical protein LSH36_127g12004 [Paralvinella palmiformis]|uniref:Uncharacterized protein n=1 Tax=Paralvinella palmiformis TaxID=53620 RepID=A0AAD9JY02_9ANNE|nr:hypothetical protein LSH36_127g12004 [Paralvinella palmiformis]
MGSSVAITVFYPIEVARVRIQVEDSRKAKYSLQMIAEIFEEEGLSALFRGWFPVVTSICCSNFVYFYVFNSLKAISYPKGTQPYPAKDLVLAFTAGVVNVLLTTPLWVANTRLKLQGDRSKNKDDKNRPKYNYKGLLGTSLTS